MKYRILFFLSIIISMGFCACTDDSDDIFINENQISTRAVNGAYTYPDVSEILKRDVVKKQMNEAWEFDEENRKFCFSLRVRILYL